MVVLEWEQWGLAHVGCVLAEVAEVLRLWADAVLMVEKWGLQWALAHAGCVVAEVAEVLRLWADAVLIVADAQRTHKVDAAAGRM